MWNKLIKILQQPASKSLGLAIIISAVLHTLFFGKVDFSLPSFKQDMHVIEARIQAPKVAPKPEEATVSEPIVEKLKPEPAPKVEKLEPAVTPEIEEQVEPKSQPDLAPEPAKPALEPAAEVNAEPVAPVLADNLDPMPVQEPDQQADSGIIINQNAYQYLETEFDVRTAIDGSAEGKATITYDVIENAQYRIRWLTEGAGIMALLFPELLQTSEGELTKTGLRPNHYLYQFGKKVEKTRSAAFDWQAKKVVLQTSKGPKTEELPDGTQDLLSFMYQFMHVPPLQNMQLPIVNGKKLRIYDYSFEGEEQVNSPLGELKTIHILHSGSSEEERTELWLAIDYQYVPVKIRKIESDGGVVEMLATRIATNRPVVNQ